MNRGIDVVSTMHASCRVLAVGGMPNEAEALRKSCRAVIKLMNAGSALLDGEPGDDEWEEFESALADAQGISL